MKVTISLFGGLLLIFIPSSIALAASPAIGVQSCKDTIVRELSTVHDVYRSVLFGTQPFPESSASSGGSSTSSSASSAAQFSVRTGGTVSSSVRGILESPGRLSSELIGPVTESYRVYRCRSRAVCAAMEQSLTQIAPIAKSISIETLGCEPVDLQTYPSCALSSPEAKVSASDIPVLTAFCTSIVTDTLSHERAVLRTAFAYDSSYRSLLQYAGMVQAMLKDVPSILFAPLKQAVQMLASFSRIPCFIGQCDAPALPPH